MRTPWMFCFHNWRLFFGSNFCVSNLIRFPSTKYIYQIISISLDILFIMFYLLQLESVPIAALLYSQWLESISYSWCKIHIRHILDIRMINPKLVHAEPFLFFSYFDDFLLTAIPILLYIWSNGLDVFTLIDTFTQWSESEAIKH